eukprot:UN11718
MITKIEHLSNEGTQQLLADLNYLKGVSSAVTEIEEELPFLEKMGYLLGLKPGETMDEKTLSVEEENELNLSVCRP